ncbi:glycosyltransferase [Methylosinus sp. H3A]|uniref:glycosyltransferase n=1 Tax=Methylosinus sp. H3A TaxID=2785786 RepID=UPI0018C274D7|nr:glycosyltransferase [Methylosinus sp. H3A]MBG0811878.1 glycosyltransferase [Methylosinus sp. H3A]
MADLFLRRSEPANAESEAPPVSDKPREAQRLVAAVSDAHRKAKHAYPIVGVVTPVRNRRDWTLGFAQSMRKQNYPFFRLYIVDSGSTDGTPEALRALGASEVVVIDDPGWHYWTAATNSGVTAALNDGCDYILTLNDDAILPDDFITNIVEGALDSEAPIVGSVISYANEPGRLWGVGAYNNWESGAFVQTGFANVFEDALDAKERRGADMIAVDYLCGNGTLVHKSVFEKIGLYEQRNAPHYHADSEFTMRAEKAGIERLIALRARLYNRFTLDADGPFSKKNMKFFSLRSANFVRAILYILSAYCPAEHRTRAFVFYYSRYLSLFDARTRSKLLRCVKFMTLSPEERRDFVPRLTPPGDPAFLACDDLDILLSLPHFEFALLAYAYLLQRGCDDNELHGYAHAIETGKPREAVIREFAGSGEYRDRPDRPLMAELDIALSAPRFGGPSVDADAELTDSQFTLACLVAARKRIPSRREFFEARRLVEAGGHSALVDQLRTHHYDADSNAFKALTKRIAKRASPPASGEAVAVYVNVDVLCMAVVDPKARTGVHRYVKNVVSELLRDSRVNLRVFYSQSLRQAWSKLVAAEPVWLDREARADEAISARAVVLLPYFPIDAVPARFAALPQSIMVHDLFPLERPEWFSAEASATFQRQLRQLLTMDHIFCNSGATQRQLLDALPTLRASSSIAYLAADEDERTERRELRQIVALPRNARYILCVGTIEPRKNLLNAIAAFALLADRPEVRDLHMLIVGQEGWKVDLTELHQTATDAMKRIHFLGRVPDGDLRTLYEGAICTVFPSLAEGFGLPILESFACGAPVVTSRGSSTEEIGGDAALLVDPLDPSEIAAAILRLATNTTERRRLKVEAVRRAQEFSWARCADAHIAEFERLATK